MANIKFIAVSRSLSGILDYVTNREKTVERLISGVNCMAQTTQDEFEAVKKQFRKTDGRSYYHIVQAFAPDDPLDFDTAHEIGLKFAEYFKGYQCVVVTHMNTAHIHNHIIMNSVNFETGQKFHQSAREMQQAKEYSNQLCREYGLSVIENPHKAPSRQVWLDEKSGRPTRYNVYREDVKEAINFSRRPYYMEEYLRRKGYITDFTGKHWKIRLPQYEHFTRLDTLDERWTPEHIQRTMGAYASFGNRRAAITYPPQMPKSLRDWFKPFQKTSHIYRLYLHYCYLLGVLPKKTTYRPTSPYLKEDLKKLEELSEQVRYMSKYGIETFDDLYADRERLQGEMDKLIAYRTKLQNKIRRASPAEKEILREEKAKVTEQITTLRKQLKLNMGIEERSIKIQEKTDLLYANEYRAKEAEQNRKSQRKERDAR